MEQLLYLVVTLGVSWLLLAPHFRQTRDQGSDIAADRLQLLDKKERLLTTLRDLDLDRATHKVTEQDYTELRAQTMLELSQIFTQLDACPH